MSAAKILVTAFGFVHCTYGVFCQSALSQTQTKTNRTNGAIGCRPDPGDFKVDFNACKQHEVFFTNSPANGSAVSWNFGDGSTGAATNRTSHVYSAEGIYGVTLIAKDAKGCRDTTVKKFLLQIDTGHIFSTKSFPLCTGTNMSLPGDSTAVQSFWSPPDYLSGTDVAYPLCAPITDTRYQYNIVKRDGANLITNGNFFDGNTGFSTKYKYDSLATGAGHYFISTNPHQVNPFFETCPWDTLYSFDTMMIVNGSTVPNTTVWNSKPQVTPNTNYIFSFIGAALTFTTSLQLQVTINGDQVISRLGLPDTPCIRKKFMTTWFSGDDTVANIRIIDLKTDSVNNSFSLDSLMLKVVALKTDSLLVSIRPTPVFSVQPASAIICPGDSVIFTGTGADQYEWFPSTTTVAATDTSGTTAFPSATTTYKVVMSENVCNVTDSVYIPVYVKAKPTVTVTKSNDLSCTVTQATLYATGGIRYHWSEDSTLSGSNTPNPVASPYQTTTYHVSVTAENGCVMQDSIEVKMIRADSSTTTFVLPSAFTPNHDGLNDRFGVHYWGYVDDLRFAIYNRWGKMVFYTTDTQKCWDGTYQGMPQPTGTYVYFVKGTTICGPVQRKGTVTLLR
ncbi:MAG TPA: gliding motility-associated C-terminal domain-containing protein [Parafilimonas sp.]|nr:gliding motility-associated C-terminal domain-containing protein [Parafilimonas sp.]